MPYPLLANGIRQGIIQAEAQITAAARVLCIHAAINPSDKKDENTYAVQVYASDDRVKWAFIGGGEHATLGPKVKRGDNRERADPRLRMEMLSPLPAGTWVRAVAQIANPLRMTWELETEADETIARLR